MDKLPITKETLLKRYNKALDKYLDICDWVTYVDSYTLCWLISRVFLMSGRYLDTEKLHDLYVAKIDSLNLPEGEWARTYDIPAIINFVYDIIVENKLLLNRYQTLKLAVFGKPK